MTIKTNRRRRFIGELREDIFIKKVRASQHLYRELDAWGIDAKVFEEALLPGNLRIRVIDLENARTYDTDAQTMRKLGEYLHFTRGEDHGLQLFLPRRYWRSYDYVCPRCGTGAMGSVCPICYMQL